MVVAGEDVLDPEPEEAARAARDRCVRADLEARRPRLGGERELPGAARPLDLREGVHVRAERIGQVVADLERAHGAAAGEIDHDGDAERRDRGRDELRRSRRAFGAVVRQPDLPANRAGERLPRRRAAWRQREPRGVRQRQAVADRGTADDDARERGSRAFVRADRTPADQRHGGERDGADASHRDGNTPSATARHASPTKRDISTISGRPSIAMYCSMSSGLRPPNRARITGPESACSAIESAG